MKTIFIILQSDLSVMFESILWFKNWCHSIQVAVSIFEEKTELYKIT